MNFKTAYALSKFAEYKEAQHMSLVETTTITLNLTPKELRIINSALSTYYSTRADVNPLKGDTLTLKSKLLDITNDNELKPYIEYD